MEGSPRAGASPIAQTPNLPKASGYMRARLATGHCRHHRCRGVGSGARVHKQRALQMGQAATKQQPLASDGPGRQGAAAARASADGSLSSIHPGRTSSSAAQGTRRAWCSLGNQLHQRNATAQARRCRASTTNSARANSGQARLLQQQPDGASRPQAAFLT